MKETLPPVLSTPRLKAVLEEVHDSVVLDYFNKNIPYFKQALHLNPHSVIKPAFMSSVKAARSYLNEAFAGYSESQAIQISRKVTLREVYEKKAVTPCLITFLSGVAPKEMFEELNAMIDLGQIKGVADGPLTATFVRAKSFETGGSLESCILIPHFFRKKKSPTQAYFKKISLKRTVDSTNVEWSVQGTELRIPRGVSILAFK